MSSALHESQSRLWENMVGRSRAGAQYLLPLLREEVGGVFAAMDADELYRRVNVVRPSLIRVEADEVTYALHIILRFELELELFEGTLEAEDLAGAWRERASSYLGIDVPDDAHGVLQDIHWAFGGFGYFPTYALGNLIAAMLWARIRADLPDIDARVAAAEFGRCATGFASTFTASGGCSPRPRRCAARPGRRSPSSRSSTTCGRSTPACTACAATGRPRPEEEGRPAAAEG